MKDLNYYKEKIKTKRKQTSFRDFLKEIVSWHPFVLHKNNGFISRFPKSSRMNVISKEEFEESREDLVKQGGEYNLGKSFWDNFEELFKNTPLPNLFHYRENENSDYTDVAVDSKNTYLSNSVVLYSQNVLYSFMVRGECDTVLNSLFVSSQSENIYFSRGIIHSYKVFYSSYINNCNNIWFSSNLTGCQECIHCSDLENSKYYINNMKLSKEEYLIQKSEILKDKNNFGDYFSKIESKGKNHGSAASSGNYVLQSENITNGNYVFNSKDGNNLMFIGAKNGNENFYDVFIAGGSGRYDNYGVASTGGSDGIYCSVGIGYSMNIYYCYHLENCSYCIGCIGLKNKNYCILNKEYSKREWEKLAIEIFKNMNEQGTLGDFFPATLNPFNFNDTVAGLIGGFEKEEIIKDGYMWREGKIKVDIPEGADVISVKDLNSFEGFDESGNWKINPEILDKVIKDKDGNIYKIVQMEYDFLVKHGLRLPRLHWMERMKLNFGIQ